MRASLLDRVDRELQALAASATPIQRMMNLTEADTVAGRNLAVIRLNRQGNVTLALPDAPEHRITGRVLSGGRPLLSFTVDGQAIDSSDGVFSIPLPNAREVRIGAVDHLLRRILLKSGVDALGDVSLPISRMVRGRVLDADGHPVTDATIRWRGNDPTLMSISSSYPPGSSSSKPPGQASCRSRRRQLPRWS